MTVVFIASKIFIYIYLQSSKVVLYLTNTNWCNITAIGVEIALLALNTLSTATAILLR